MDKEIKNIREFIKQKRKQNAEKTKIDSLSRQKFVPIEMINQLNDNPELFFAEIGKHSDFIKSEVKHFYDEYDKNFFENYLLCLEVYHKKLEERKQTNDDIHFLDNVFGRNFENLLYNFKEFINNKNKNNESLIFMIYKKNFFGLLVRLIEFCIKNDIKLDITFNKEKNLVDALLEEIDCLKVSIIHFKACKAYKLEENIKEASKLDSLNNDYDFLIKNKKLKLEKIKDILYLVDKSFNSVIILEVLNYSEAIYKDRIYQALVVKKNVSNLSELINSNIKNIKNKNDLSHIFKFIESLISNKNFEYFTEELFLFCLRLFYYGNTDKVLILLNKLSKMVTDIQLLKFLYCIKHFKHEILEVCEANSKYHGGYKATLLDDIDVETLNNSSFEYNDYYTNFSCQTFIELIFKPNNICSNTFNSLNECSLASYQVVEFIFNISKKNNVFKKLFNLVHLQHESKLNQTIKALALTANLTVFHKKKILDFFEKSYNDNEIKKNPNALNFYQQNFFLWKYFIQELNTELKHDDEKFLKDIFSCLKIKAIKAQIFNDVYNIYDGSNLSKLMKEFQPVFPKNNDKKLKNICNFFNCLKPEIYCNWLRHQNSVKKLDIFIKCLIENNIFDLQPFYFDSKIFTNFGQNKDHHSLEFKCVSIINGLNSVCKAHKLHLPLNQLEEIFTIFTRELQEKLNSINDDNDKSIYRMIYSNLKLFDFLEFFNVQVFNNHDLLSNNNNDSYDNYISSEFLELLNSALKIITGLIDSAFEINCKYKEIFARQHLRFIDEIFSKSFLRINKAFVNDSLNYYLNFSNVIYTLLKRSLNFSRTNEEGMENINNFGKTFVENIYFYIDKDSSQIKIHQRNILSNGFLEKLNVKIMNNEINNKDELKYLFSEFYDINNQAQILNKKKRLELIYLKSFNDMNSLQKFNAHIFHNAIFNQISETKRNDDSYTHNKIDVSFIFNIFKAIVNCKSHPSNNEYSELTENLLSLFRSIFYGLIKRENIFKVLSLLLKKITLEFSQANAVELIEKLLNICLGNFNIDFFNKFSVNDIKYYNGRVKINFFEFIHALIRDLILIDFSMDEASYKARLNILLAISNFLKIIRNQEFNDYFNIAIYLIFKINFLNNKKSFLLKEFKVSGHESSRDYHKIIYKKDKIKDIIFYDGNNKRRIFSFKSLNSDNKEKTTIKLKSLNLILHFKLKQINNNDLLLEFLSLYEGLLVKINQNEVILNVDLPDLFNDLYLYDDVKFKNQKNFDDYKNNKKNLQSNSLFISAELLKDILLNVIKKENKQNGICEINENHIYDSIYLLEAYDVLISMLSEFFCFIDASFFRDYFKNLLFKFSQCKYADNSNHSLYSHLKFFYYQIKEFCDNILPLYAEHKNIVKGKLLNLAFNKTQFFKSKRIGAIYLKNTLDYRKERIFLRNGISPMKLRLPYFIKITVSEENKNFNSTILDFNSLIINERKIINNFYQIKSNNNNYHFKNCLNADIKRAYSIFNKNSFVLGNDILLSYQQNFDYITSKGGSAKSPGEVLNNNILLNSKFSIDICNNLILNILKDNSCFNNVLDVYAKMDSSVNKYLNSNIFNKNNRLNFCNFIFFLDFHKILLHDSSKTNINFKIDYNPFSILINTDISDNSFAPHYLDLLFKLDQLDNDRNTNYNLQYVFNNFFPLRKITEYFNENNYKGINLLIQSSKIYGVGKNKNTFEKVGFDSLAFLNNIKLFAKVYSRNVSNINMNGLIVESFLYVLKFFLIHNSDLKKIYNYTSHNFLNPCKDCYSYKCSKICKEVDRCKAKEIKKDNLERLIVCHAEILGICINEFDVIFAQQSTLNTEIFDLLTKHLFLLYNILAYKIRENIKSSSNKSYTIQGFNKLLGAFVKKVFTRIMGLNKVEIDQIQDNKGKHIPCLNDYWRNVEYFINNILYHLNDEDMLLFYNPFRELFFQMNKNSSITKKFSEFENQLFVNKGEIGNMSDLIYHLENKKHYSLLLLQLAIFYNDIEFFDKLISYSNGEILFEKFDAKLKLISKSLEIKRSTIAKNLLYCSKSSLNSFYFLNLNKYNNNKDFTDNQTNSCVLNFQNTFLIDNNLFKRHNYYNPFDTLISLQSQIDEGLKNSKDNSEFIEKFLTESTRAFKDYTFDKEAEEYFDYIFLAPESVNAKNNYLIYQAQKKENGKKDVQDFKINVNSENQISNDTGKFGNIIYTKYENLNFSDEDYLLKKIYDLLTSDDKNILLRNKSKDYEKHLYFNINKFIIVLLKTKNIELLADLKIHGKSAAEIILRNVNFYFKIIAKYIQDFSDLYILYEKCFKNSEVFKNSDCNLFELFIEYLKLGNKKMIDSIFKNEEISNLINIVNSISLDSDSGMKHKDSINLENNFSTNKKLNFIIFHCIWFNLKNIMFYIIEQITGIKDLKKLLYNTNSLIELKLNNNSNPICLNPLFVEIAINLGHYELVFILNRFIKFDENLFLYTPDKMQSNFFERKNRHILNFYKKYNFIKGEIFEKKNLKLYKKIKKYNKFLFTRIVFLEKIKLYLDKKYQERRNHEEHNKKLVETHKQNKSRDFNEAYINDLNVFNRNNPAFCLFENSIIGILTNEYILQYLLFLDPKNQKFIDIKDLINFINMNEKEFTLTIIILFLYLGIKPLNPCYLKDFIEHFLNKKNANPQNLVSLIRILEYYLGQDSLSLFCARKNSVNISLEQYINLVKEIEEEKICDERENLNTAYLINKADIEFIQQIETDYRYIGSELSMFMECENKEQTDYSSSLLNNIKENIFSFKMFDILLKLEKGNKLILFDYLFRNKENHHSINYHGILSSFIQDLNEEFYEIIRNEENNDNKNAKYYFLSKLLNLHNTFFSFENLLVSQINLYLINEPSSYNDILKENFVDNECEGNENQNSLIKSLDIAIDKSANYSLSFNKYSFEFNYGIYDSINLFQTVYDCLLTSQFKNVDETLNLLEQFHGKKYLYKERMKKIIEEEGLSQQEPEEDFNEYKNKDLEEIDLGGNAQMFNISFDTSHNSDILLILLIFNQKMFVSVVNSYFSDLQRYQRFDSLCKKNNKEEVKFDSLKDHTILVILKDFKKYFSEMNFKIENLLLANGKEYEHLINLLFSDFKNSESINYFFKNLSSNHEQNINKIVDLIVQKIETFINKSFINKKNVITDLDIAKYVFRNQRKVIFNQLQKKLEKENFFKKLNSLNTNSNGLKSNANANIYYPKNVVDYFAQLMIDNELIGKILNYYIDIVNILYSINLDQREKAKFNDFGKFNNESINYKYPECGYLCELFKCFNFDIIKFNLKFIDYGDSKICDFNQNFNLNLNEETKKKILESKLIKSQLENINRHNTKSLAEVIFSPLIFINEQFLNNDNEILTENLKEELKIYEKDGFECLNEIEKKTIANILQKISEMQKNGKNKIKISDIESLYNDTDSTNKLFILGKFYYAKFLKGLKHNQIDMSIDIPIDFQYNFNLNHLSEKISKFLIQNILSKNIDDDKDIISNTNYTKREILIENGVIKTCECLPFIENKGQKMLDAYVREIFDNITSTFNLVVFGSRDLSTQTEIKQTYTRNSKALISNTIFYLLADFYKNLAPGFDKVQISNSLFLKNLMLDKIKDEVDVYENILLRNNLSNGENNKLVNRLCNFELEKNTVSSLLWNYNESILLVNSINENSFLNFIKNYMLIPLLTGHMFLFSYDKFIKFIMFVYNLPCSKNKIFEKIIIQFEKMVKDFIFNEKNFLIKTFEEIFANILYIEKNHFESNINKYLNPYQSNQPFYTFILKIKHYIEMFYIDENAYNSKEFDFVLNKKRDENNKNKNLVKSFANRFEESVFVNNVSKIKINIHKFEEILETKQFNFLNFNHKFYGIKALFDNYFNFTFNDLLNDSSHSEVNVNYNRADAIQAVNSIIINFEKKIADKKDSYFEKLILYVDEIELTISNSIQANNSYDLYINILIDDVDDISKVKSVDYLRIINKCDLKVKENIQTKNK